MSNTQYENPTKKEKTFKDSKGRIITIIGYEGAFVIYKKGGEDSETKKRLFIDMNLIL